MRLNPGFGITLAWLSLALVWLAGLAFTKRTVRSQPAGARLFHLALALFGFALLSDRWFRTGWLAERFIPHLHGVPIAGFALTAAGCAFAIWARLMLGSNWSGRATVKGGHELVMSGPYALARHPIYTGLLCAIAGTALATGEWRGVVAFFVILFAFTIKMSQEERLMMQTFPDAYPLYRRRVKALVPGIL
jgi:protein-S-isoprenylcysteine O-methyltransferase Ste14